MCCGDVVFCGNVMYVVVKNMFCTVCFVVIVDKSIRGQGL